MRLVRDNPELFEDQSVEDYLLEMADIRRDAMSYIMQQPPGPLKGPTMARGRPRSGPVDETGANVSEKL